MVTIRKSTTADGTWFDIEDFPSYVAALREHNIDAPLAKYRVFISAETEPAIRAACADLEGQVALFFRLGSSSGIPYRFIGP
jgi:hypothetical protein